MRVRCILVETTVPVKIRPRIETRPVKGHFLSVGIESQFSEFSKYAPSVSSPKSTTSPDPISCFLKPKKLSHNVSPIFRRTTNSTYRCSFPQSQSLVCGNPIQRPCTIFGLPFRRRWTSTWTWSSRRYGVASGKRARSGRSIRWPWLRWLSSRKSSCWVLRRGRKGLGIFTSLG